MSWWNRSASQAAPGTLDRIMKRKREELDARTPIAPYPHPAPRDFAGALLRRAPGRPVSVIAEVKRKSPSGGAFPHTDVVAVARAYEAAGASAISVLTDGPDFGGSLADLVAVRAAVSVPVLRKDFLVAAQEVEESALFGADAVLLIADALEDGELREMLAAARTARIAALVEAHTEAHAERALAAGAELVGINNRDLATLKTDVGTALRVMPRLRARARALVAESGLKSVTELIAAREAGADAVLVGESLLRDAEPGRALTRLLGEDGTPP
ncbi:indole-3-glycerol phosphate synthase TrpC [Myxococcus sp. K38C18041901]|uniref:indole-3-glycerol phosphate synthase TrpC n=1 Tax=Myxococcus guangdongensis TaxID=2906760 RepID=UPI0020A76420|nr:indole-3-glycerol phosphate synthase TrpC [Myxococcus guangdongensis]MCP3062199.1 indole-3-glycerol phosphate synthase TrpC [Myxococcus guangdongensis]